MTQLYDDSNWREEYKSYTSNERHLELLEQVNFLQRKLKYYKTIVEDEKE